MVLLLAVAFAVVVRRRRLRPTAGWTIFAGGLLLLAVGDGVYALPVNTDIGTTGLSWADPLYVLGSLVIVAGALRLKSAHVGEGDREGLIDATSIGLAAAVLLWNPLIEPRFNLADTPLLARVVNASYPILDVVVLAMMLWLLLGARRWTPTTVMLVGGAVFYLPGRLRLHGPDRPGHDRRPVAQLARHPLARRLRPVPAGGHAPVGPTHRPNGALGRTSDLPRSPRPLRAHAPGPDDRPRRRWHRPAPPPLRRRGRGGPRGARPAPALGPGRR